MKNQWGWGGFTSRDLKSSQFMSRIIALIYNWWSLFVRMANPAGHKEAITSKPLLLSAIGRVTESGRQKKMTITSLHGKSDEVREVFQNICQFFFNLTVNAPQLSPMEAWIKILAKVVEKIIPENGVGPPKLSFSAN